MTTSETMTPANRKEGLIDKLATPANLLAAPRLARKFQNIGVQILRPVDTRVTPAG